MVFAVMGLCAGLKRSLGFFLPMCLQSVSEALVTLERIRNFMLLPDKTSSRLLQRAPLGPGDAAVVRVEDLSARYEAETRPVLSCTPPRPSRS